jgi:hypothetical protein
MNSVPRSDLDDLVIDELRRLNELDLELYRRARERFAATTPVPAGDAAARATERPLSDVFGNFGRLFRRFGQR